MGDGEDLGMRMAGARTEYNLAKVHGLVRDNEI